MKTGFVKAAAVMKPAAIALALTMLGGCAIVDRVLEPATGAVARGIDRACSEGTSTLGVEARREIVAAVNAKTTVGNHTPSDCDGDGLPDFEIDADGIPVPTS